MAEPLLTSAFILHTRAFKETSIILDTFTLEHGRVSILAKGVRSNSRKNNRKALLQPFQPLQLSWVGRSDLKTMKQLDAQGLPIRLSGIRSLSGLYLNELLLKLLIQWDPHPDIFEHYIYSLKMLEQNAKPQISIREFELFLLDELGYAIDWTSDSSGDGIELGQFYVYMPQQGFISQRAAPGNNLLIKGDLILAVASRQWQISGSLALARKVCRQIIDQLLSGKELNSRKLLQQTLALQS